MPTMPIETVISASTPAASPTISTPIPAPVFTTQAPTPQTQTPPAPPLNPAKEDLEKLPSSQELNQLVEMAKQIQQLRSKIGETEKQINDLKVAAANSGNTNAYVKQSQEAFDNLHNLIKETENIYSKNAKLAKKAAKMRIPKIVEAKPSSVVHQIALTSLPNVINGMVIDSKGIYLDGVIVIIHNKDGLPVRALRTNKIGQFTGATPLPNGLYTLSIEKEGLEFDVLQITLNGEVIAPIQVTPRQEVPLNG
jgi:hypothetical protein